MSKKCYHTYNHVALVEKGGNVMPCCQYVSDTDTPYSQMLKPGEGLQDLLSSKVWQDTRNKLDNNESVSECRICFDQEKSGLISRRNWYNSIWEKENIEPKKEVLQTMEIALDFTCNMMCKHCKPSQSSKWAQAKTLIDNLDNLYKNTTHYSPYNDNKSFPTFQQDIKQIISNTNFSELIMLRLVGGEPFYSKNFPYLMEKIKSSVNVNNFEFAVNTNGSIIPTDDIIDFFKSIKRTRIDISIDAIGELGECLRHGISWQVLHDNIMKWKDLSKEYPSIKLSIHPTISLMNVNRMQDIIDYCDEHDLPITFHQLDSPSFLNHKQLPLLDRKKWMVKSSKQSTLTIEQLNRCITTGTVLYNHLNKGITALELLDSYQGTSFKTVNKEIWNIMKKQQIKSVFDLSFINRYYSYIYAPHEWKHEFNELMLLFNPAWKSIAVNLSGGADSACLTSILATLIEKHGYNCKIHIISHVRVWQTRPWGAPISLDVYNKLKQRWPDIIGDRLVNFIPTELEESAAGPDLVNGRSGDRIIVGAFNQYAQHTYNFDAVFNGVTLNPQSLETDIRPHDRNRLPDFENDIFEPIDTKKGQTYRPFEFVEKDFIMACYLRHGWQDLLSITRSCEGDSAVDSDLFVDYTEYKHGVTPLAECGECFWCKERKWALDRAEILLGRKLNDS